VKSDESFVSSLVTRHSSLTKNLADSLISTYRAFENAHLRLRFVLRSFVSSVCRSAKRGTG
jgi:hypothetical protein